MYLVILKNCLNGGVVDLILWNQVTKYSEDIDELGARFAYEESMGAKECLAFIEGHLLPASTDRLVVLRFGNTNAI